MKTRRLWLLAGARERSRQAAQRLLCERHLWLGEPPPGAHGGSAREAFRWLGRELDLLVIDAHAGLDVEALGAASGALRGGGLLLLLTPPLDDWPQRADPDCARIAPWPHAPDALSGYFLQRLLRVLRAHKIAVYGADETLPDWRPPSWAHPPGWRSADQHLAIEAILELMRSERGACVLTADRGRGKSAALGMAAAQLIADRNSRILLTAPRRAAVDAVFMHAAAALPAAQSERSLLSLSARAQLRFSAPDALLHERPEADLLLIDEAAAIPASLLQKLLTIYPRCVFSSTVHGYEGTGQGFALRFAPTLRALHPDCRTLHLHEPVRWAEDDPLERFIFDALLLNARACATEILAQAASGDCVIERVERASLAQNEAQLRELFGLLILAHYRTSPLDLRQLLDGADVQIWRASWRKHTVAVALIMREGGFDAALANAVYRGERRVRGHLLPQSLALHSGFAEAAELSGVRVLRIAAHPALQRQGLGSRLLDAIAADARAKGLDFIGASFGASGALLDFWRQAGFLPLRLGHTREASSGSHALLLARALSARGQTLLSAIHTRFLQHLPALLADGISGVDEAVSARLRAAARSIEADDAALSAQDWRDIDSFVRGARGYAICQVPLRKLVQLAQDGAPLSAAQRELIRRKLLLCEPWPALVSALGFAGRAQAIDALRVAIGVLVRAAGE